MNAPVWHLRGEHLQGSFRPAWTGLTTRRIKPSSSSTDKVVCTLAFFLASIIHTSVNTCWNAFPVCLNDLKSQFIWVVLFFSLLVVSKQHLAINSEQGNNTRDFFLIFLSQWNKKNGHFLKFRDLNHNVSLLKFFLWLNPHRMTCSGKKFSLASILKRE